MFFCRVNDVCTNRKEALSKELCTPWYTPCLNEVIQAGGTKPACPEGQVPTKGHKGKIHINFKFETASMIASSIKGFSPN